MLAHSLLVVLLVSAAGAQEGEPQVVTDQQGDGSSKIPTTQESGPNMYYSEGFLLSVKPGFIIQVREGTVNKGEVVIDKPAPTVKGSLIGTDEYSMTFDWKLAAFENKGMKVTNLILKMGFSKNTKTWKLKTLNIARATVDNENIVNNDIWTVSSNGYEVSAPLGNSFCCYGAGVFNPTNATRASNKYKLSMKMPDLQLQVFAKKLPPFGPAWSCGGTGVGLWVGIFLALFFASVCYMGFGMLANIQTMDRFDDPKGKPLHIPQSD